MKCHWCGASIPDEAKTCPRCRARLKRGVTRCRFCGRSIRAGLSLCPYCGYELGRRRVSWWLIVGVSGAVLAIAALAIFFLPLNLPSFSLPALVSIASPTPAEILLPPTATPEPPTPTPTRRPIPPTPTLTSTPSPTSTSSPTSIPTPTPASTATFTPTSLPTATLFPTDTPTPTETPPFKYPAPRLTEPPNDPFGNTPFGGEDPIWLGWEPVGPLAEDELYSVSLRFIGPDGRTIYDEAWVEGETKWRVPPEDFDKADRQERSFQWDVTVVRKIVNPDGTTRGENISPTSETWVFYWR